MISSMIWLCMASLSAQTSPYYANVTLDVRESSLRDVLKDISDQTRLCFVYDDALVHRKYATYMYTDVQAENILKRIAADNGLSYQVYSDQIVVFYKKPPKRTVQSNHGVRPLMYIPPMLTQKIPIYYPYNAKLKGHEGKVQVLITINNEGHVSKVDLNESSGSYILDQATLEHVKNLRFSPAVLNDEPVHSLMELSFEFRLVNYSNELVEDQIHQSLPDR